MKRRAFLGLLPLFALASCITPPAVEPMAYTVPASHSKTMSAIVEGFTALGYRIDEETPNSVTFEQQQTFEEGLFVNRVFRYQIAVTGSAPTKVQPRILMSQGRGAQILTVDVTNREAFASKLRSQIEPIITKLGGSV
ncbi:MAG: hypothetical protein ABGX47_00880 [Martelella sp.]|uniref:hypothetical protein n=1 Tax=Martelella sp. TaxID=1969699 RepID=UPI003241FA2E